MDIRPNHSSSRHASSFRPAPDPSLPGKGTLLDVPIRTRAYSRPPSPGKKKAALAGLVLAFGFVVLGAASYRLYGGHPADPETSDLVWEEVERLRKENSELKDEMGFLVGDEEVPAEDAARADSGPSAEALQASSPRRRLQADMAAAAIVATACQDDGAEVFSGRAGDRMCSGDIWDDAWPAIGVCGPNPDDTRWTVFYGGEVRWNVTVECRNLPECNGPGNAICDGRGCRFGGGCRD
jgi:hypothetical protein